MASYTAIPDSDLDPGEPLTSSKIKSLNNNLEGVTEGVSGAPRIKTAAIDSDVVADALGRDFNDSSTTVGDVGTVAFLRYSGGSQVGPGNTVVASGGVLEFAGFEEDSGVSTEAKIVSTSTPAVTGTWLCLGFLSGLSDIDKEATLFVRVS